LIIHTKHFSQSISLKVSRLVISAQWFFLLWMISTLNKDKNQLYIKESLNYIKESFTDQLSLKRSHCCQLFIFNTALDFMPSFSFPFRCLKSKAWKHDDRSASSFRIKCRHRVLSDISKSILPLYHSLAKLGSRKSDTTRASVL